LSVVFRPESQSRQGFEGVLKGVLKDGYCPESQSGRSFEGFEGFEGRVLSESKRKERKKGVKKYLNTYPS
jgi:hypothetical protein